MLESILSSTVTTAAVTGGEMLWCTLASLLGGILAALLYTFRNKNYSRSFLMTLALLPMLVQVVILLVNGNLGTGVAVAGAFSLVRFRSAPGSAREITAIFMAMGLGLATGTGYLGVAALLLIAFALVSLFFALTRLGESKSRERQLRVTVPESLDYTHMFDDLFEKYTKAFELISAKTTNMGSLFELTYRVTFKPETNEKQFIDALRCRNGNLGISCGQLLPDPAGTL